jgi:MoaA/NifB/PqqE/SkfB family radical SAM enzyme
MHPDHFRAELPPKRALRLFRSYVELIEFETTSYCNRVCSFCPNRQIDRRSEHHSMPEVVWSTILEGLRKVEYDGTVVWSRYSEPLSEPRIVERIKQVKAAAPRSRVCINTNGDYLDHALLRNLVAAGVARLWVDLYLPDDAPYEASSARAVLHRFLERIGARATEISTEPELVAKVELEGVEITAHCRNAGSMQAMDLSDRGGLVASARRTNRVSPCYAPYKHLVIDWDGSVLPCCQLRSDSEAHAPSVACRVGFDGVDLIRAYVRLASWRAGLRSFGPKTPPCAGCNVGEYNADAASVFLGRVLTGESQIARALRAASRTFLPRAARH